MRQSTNTESSAVTAKLSATCASNVPVSSVPVASIHNPSSLMVDAGTSPAPKVVEIAIRVPSFVRLRTALRAFSVPNTVSLAFGAVASVPTEM